MVRMNDGNDYHVAEQIFELGALLTTEELHAAAETVMAAIMSDGSSHWAPRWQGLREILLSAKRRHDCDENENTRLLIGQGAY